MQEILLDPNIVFLLITLGIFALTYEFAAPGGFLAGLIGTALLLLGGYALTLIPFSILGLVLLTIGIIIMAAEAFVVTKGLLAIFGAVIFALGSMLMFDGENGQRLSWITIGSTTVFIGGGLTFLLAFVVRTYRQRPDIDFSLKGQKALVVDWNKDAQRVEADGAFWQARSLSNRHYSHGDWVVIQGQDNITLLVE